MTEMGRLEYGRLTEAWRGEATDFTPLLAQRLGELGRAVGIDLADIGPTEIPIASGRRIDIVAQDADGVEFVIENQYGTADHDHLTRGLAYAVARQANGLIIVAEGHRDEFRAVAEYLNTLAELDRERGVFVWLVEAKAVRIGNSAWAPLFTSVAEPNEFIASIAPSTADRRVRTAEEFWGAVDSDADGDAFRGVLEKVLRRWDADGEGRRYVRYARNHAVLEARGPSAGGRRSVVAIYTDGRVMVPFSSYQGVHSGIPVDALVTDEFRSRADSLFGFGGSEQMATTTPGWLTADRADELLRFCDEVVAAYAAALDMDE